jgi:hypothetical protein
MVTRVKNEDDMKKKELAKQEAEVVSHVFEYISCFHIFFRLYSYCLPFMKFLFTFFSACQKNRKIMKKNFKTIHVYELKFQQNFCQEITSV